MTYDALKAQQATRSRIEPVRSIQLLEEEVQDQLYQRLAPVEGYDGAAGDDRAVPERWHPLSAAKRL